MSGKQEIAAFAARAGGDPPPVSFCTAAGKPVGRAIAAGQAVDFTVWPGYVNREALWEALVEYADAAAELRSMADYLAEGNLTAVAARDDAIAQRQAAASHCTFCGTAYPGGRDDRHRSRRLARHRSPRRPRGCGRDLYACELFHSADGSLYGRHVSCRWEFIATGPGAAASLDALDQALTAAGYTRTSDWRRKTCGTSPSPPSESRTSDRPVRSCTATALDSFPGCSSCSATS
ncbi:MULTISPECIES: hypothetical protein [Nocardia]|uniref:hypothetical protein n=1 Tax=Nocardia TaxID=1817 RepID=UPI002455D082|nr:MULTISPECIES: hypothetical protein [Nocardia]